MQDTFQKVGSTETDQGLVEVDLITGLEGQDCNANFIVIRKIDGDNHCSQNFVEVKGLNTG